MFTRLTVVSTLVLAGLAGLANAQTNGPMVAREETSPSQPMMQEHQGRERHQVAITDEYGFKYDSRGDRLDANGHVIDPPHTLPGAAVR
jgi:hypothetical protein